MNDTENPRGNWHRNRKDSRFNNHKKLSNQNKELKDFVYYIVSNKQASNLESTINLMIQCIKDKFHYANDFAKLLRNLDYESTEK